MIIRKKRLTGILIVVALILIVPLIAMQFSEEVNWDLFDFAVAGVLLLTTGLVIELVMSKVKNKNHRLGLVAVILIALFLIWAELAVGVFGTPFAGS